MEAVMVENGGDDMGPVNRPAYRNCTTVLYYSGRVS